MVRFVEAAHERYLTPNIRSLFYDSNSCCCYFEFVEEVQEVDPIANELLEIALKTISQFDWFGRVFHGKLET